MAYRGYLALDGVEIANSARVAAHLGAVTPTVDYGYFSTVDGSYTLPTTTPNITIDPTRPWVFTPGVGFNLTGRVRHPESTTKYLMSWSPYTPIQSITYPGLGLAMSSQSEVSPGLWTPPTGARIFGPGLFVHDQNWGNPAACAPCQTKIVYNDSWPGQREWLEDVDYRPELAPWYSAEIPESGEFGGVWVMSLDGLDSTPVERSITQSSGNGAVAGPSRDGSRTVQVEALLVACSNAGVEYGLKWLTQLLRATTRTRDIKLRYLTGSPAQTSAVADSLVREAYGCVLTQAPRVTERINSGGRPNQHGTMYRVNFELTLLSPYAYLPQVEFPVEWDQISRQSINWIHATDCNKPETCLEMPVLFSADCVPEEIDFVTTQPPVCGGCLPISAIDKYTFRVPTMEYAFRGRETVISLTLKNTGTTPLTVQSFWRVCNTDVRCEDNRYPLQVSGLPAGSELHLNGITGRYTAWDGERWRRPVGIVGTANGAPWRPPIIDRQTCWDFIVQAPVDALFEATMSFADREP